MKITSLVENISENENIGYEHGLSLFIETEKHNILFDMGQTDLFSENAEKLSIDLSSVDIAVLSHGHYDHGGGLSKFLLLNDKAKVYINKNAFGDYYNGTEKYIGLDKSLMGNSRIILTEDFYEIEKGLSLLKNGGGMNIAIYYGRETGFEEKDSVLEYLKTIDSLKYTVLVTEFSNRTNCYPISVFIMKD